jgi:hypothetical protein
MKKTIDCPKDIFEELVWSDYIEGWTKVDQVRLEDHRWESKWLMVVRPPESEDLYAGEYRLGLTEMQQGCWFDDAPDLITLECVTAVPKVVYEYQTAGEDWTP